MPTTSSTTSKATPSSQRGRCADLRRVAIEITASRVAPPRQRRAECRACGTDTAVPVDPEPPVLCSACHLDAGDVVLDRETGHRLVVLQVTPGRADEVAVAGGDTTVAAHPTNEGYPPADPVGEVVYATSVIRNDGPTRDSFPLSRLAPTDDAAIVDADPLPD